MNQTETTLKKYETHTHLHLMMQAQEWGSMQLFWSISDIHGLSLIFFLLLSRFVHALQRHLQLKVLNNDTFNYILGNALVQINYCKKSTLIRFEWPILNQWPMFLILPLTVTISLHFSFTACLNSVIWHDE